MSWMIHQFTTCQHVKWFKVNYVALLFEWLNIKVVSPRMIICHFLKATREYSHHARLMSEPPGIISVLRFRPPRSVAAAPPLLFGHLLLRKWDSFEKSEGFWYQSCYVTVWPVCCYCLDHSNTL